VKLAVVWFYRFLFNLVKFFSFRRKCLQNFPFALCCEITMKTLVLKSKWGLLSALIMSMSCLNTFAFEDESFSFGNGTEMDMRRTQQRNRLRNEDFEFQGYQKGYLPLSSLPSVGEGHFYGAESEDEDYSSGTDDSENESSSSKW
jgi:hypothetical protein